METIKTVDQLLEELYSNFSVEKIHKNRTLCFVKDNLKNIKIYNGGNVRIKNTDQILNIIRTN